MYAWDDPVNLMDPSGEMAEGPRIPLPDSSGWQRLAPTDTGGYADVFGRVGGVVGQNSQGSSRGSSSAGDAGRVLGGTAAGVADVVRGPTADEVHDAQVRYRSTPEYVAQRTAEVTQRVHADVCGTAEHLPPVAPVPAPMSGVFGNGIGPLFFAWALPVAVAGLAGVLLPLGLLIWWLVDPESFAGFWGGVGEGISDFFGWLGEQNRKLNAEVVTAILTWLYQADIDMNKALDSAVDAVDDILDDILPTPGKEPEPGESGSGGKPPITPPGSINLPDPDDKDWGDWPKQDPQRSNCEQVAREIQQRIGGEIHRITPKEAIYLPESANNQGDTWFYHEVVVKNGRVYDGTTGPKGMSIADYKALFNDPDWVNWGF